MSWLNFNDSLNSIKGQLTSFASGVAEGLVGEPEPGQDVGDSTEVAANKPQNAWSWEPPAEPAPVDETQQLYKKIEQLESEKKELVLSLEQLDLDCQQTTDKLVTLKDELQTSYNDLRTDFDKLQKEYGDVLTENMQLEKEIDGLRRARKDVGVTEEDPVENVSISSREREIEDVVDDEKEKESKELKDVCEKLKEENGALRRDLEVKRIVVDEFKLENNNLKSIAEENGLEISKLKEAAKINKELLDENTKLEKQIEKLKGDLELLRTNEGSLKSECSHLFPVNMEMAERLEHLKNINGDVERLQSENETLKESLKEVSVINREIDELRVKNNQLQDENNGMKQLQNEVRELRLINERLQLETNKQLSKDEEDIHQIKQLQLINSQLLNENNQMKEDENKMQLFNEQLRCENNEIKQKNDKVTEELRLVNNELQENVLKQSKELEALQLVHNEREIRIKQLTQENEQLKVEFLEKQHLVEQQEQKGHHEKIEQLQKINKELVVDKQKLYEELTETQARTLEEKHALHKKYLSIITEKMKKYLDMNSEAPIAALLPDEPQIMEFAGKVETLLKVLLDFKCKIEALEKDLCQVTQEKNNTIAEKNFEIEKLLKNSEILSQEVIGKTQTIKDYEDECAELMKNNELLIAELQTFKSGGLQTIQESNEDNLLLLEQQLETANKKIKDMESIISDLENPNSNLEAEELEYIKKQLNLTGQELSRSKADYEQLATKYEELVVEKTDLKSALDKVKTDYESAEFKYEEVNFNFEALKEETEECKKKVIDFDNSERKLEASKHHLEDQISKLENTIDDLKQKEFNLVEEMAQKDQLVRNLTERLQDSKMCETTLKLQIDTMRKTTADIKHNLENKLEQSEKTIVELRERLENGDKTETFQNEHSQLKNELNLVRERSTALQSHIAALEGQINELATSRNELIALITAKHQENVQYHAEIQRLSQILASEAEKTSSNTYEELQRKEYELSATLEEVEKLRDQNNFLREKCEVLAQNLLQEQSNVQKVLAERQTVSEKEQAMTKELERLRAHLVEIEDMYTQELLLAEQKNKEMQAKVSEIQQREKDSSSIYTSVSIRANQQVEALQTQLQLVTNQRDELRLKVSDLEDGHNKQVAALTNLQLVLEQFQKEKDHNIYLETERVRRQITVEKQVQQDLRNEIAFLKSQLEESKQGLQAASRLTDQLEKCKRQLVNYRDEVSQLYAQLQKSDEKCKELTTHTEAKVDKTLIKNLVIGYVTSPTADQNQILKIIATVLDFNQKETDKVNLNKAQGGSWLSSILHPQGPNSSEMSQQSLSEAFVRFLENESKPKVLPNLLVAEQAKGSDSGSSRSTTPKQNPLVLSEVMLPTFVDFAKSRNSSSILKDALKDNS